jgi:methionyl-tRNA formyltransferase
MKIGFFGDGPWSHNAIRMLTNDPSFEIDFICVRFDNPDNTLIDFAKSHDIKLFIEKNVNSNNFLKKIDGCKLDLIVSMSFDQIFKKEIINLPRFKSINCHAGKLPFYRGRNVLNWVLINDESEFGITVHFIDEGIDTGDIILQKIYPINDNDDYSTLLAKAYEECGSLLYESIKSINEKTAIRIKQNQIDVHGSYCTQRKEGDERVNWNNTARDVFNFIRALTSPGPISTTFYRDEKVKIYKAEIVNGATLYKGINGAIINVQKDAFLVKTSDSFIKIIQWNPEFNPKIGMRLQ